MVDARVPVTPAGDPKVVAEPAVAGGASSSSSGSLSLAHDASLAASIPVESAPATPPKRSSLQARAGSSTPPKRQRGSSPVKSGEAEAFAVYLPVVVDGPCDTNAPPFALSLPPSGGGVPAVKKHRFRGQGGDMATVPEPRSARARTGRLVGSRGGRAVPRLCD